MKLPNVISEEQMNRALDQLVDRYRLEYARESSRVVQLHLRTKLDFVIDFKEALGLNQKEEPVCDQTCIPIADCGCYQCDTEQAAIRERECDIYDT